MLTYLVCYDIEDAKIRRRVAKYLLQYGDRVQMSVYQVRVKDQAHLEELIECISTTMGDETNLKLFRLCQNCLQSSMDLCREPAITYPTSIIV